MELLHSHPQRLLQKCSVCASINDTPKNNVNKIPVVKKFIPSDDQVTDSKKRIRIVRTGNKGVCVCCDNQLLSVEF